MDQLINQPINQPINPSINQSIIPLFCSCLEFFPTSAEKREHQKLCFAQYSCMTTHYGEALVPTFYDSPFHQEKLKNIEKTEAKRQLMKIASTLLNLDNWNMDQYGKPIPHRSNDPLSLPNCSALPSDPAWQREAQDQIRQISRQLDSDQRGETHFPALTQSQTTIDDYFGNRKTNKNNSSNTPNFESPCGSKRHLPSPTSEESKRPKTLLPLPRNRVLFPEESVWEKSERILSWTQNEEEIVLAAD